MKTGGMDLLQLIRNQKVSMAMSVWELHQYISKTEIDQIEQELSDLEFQDPLVVVREIEERIENLSIKIALRKEHSEILVKNMTQKFYVQWRDDEEYDPARLRFKLLNPELRTRIYPYLPYKKYRTNILKCANLAYIDKYCEIHPRRGISRNMMGPFADLGGNDPHKYLNSHAMTNKTKDKLKNKTLKHALLNTKSSKKLLKKGKKKKEDADKESASSATTIPELMFFNDPFERKMQGAEAEEYR